MIGIRRRRDPRDVPASALSALTDGSPTAEIGERRMRDLLGAGAVGDTEVFTAEEGEDILGYAHLGFSRPVAAPLGVAGQEDSRPEDAGREDARPEDVPAEGAGPDGTGRAGGPLTAWLISGAVLPAHRRRGIGSALLHEVREVARAAGATSLRLSGRPEGYAVPGPDPERDPGTARFLEEHGAQASGTALAMTRPLLDLDPVRPRAGIEVRACRDGDLPAITRAVAVHLDPGWADLLDGYAAGGGDLSRILLARDRDGAVLGFAGWGLVGRDPSRFGPFGVLPAARGRGAGAVLLETALHRMAGEGMAHAWFQWTAPDSPAHRLYSSRGFVPLRTFTPFVIPLDGSPPSTDAAPVPDTTP